jgi:hypothetical protein
MIGRSVLSGALALVVALVLLVSGAGLRHADAAERKQVSVGPVSIAVPADWVRRKGPAADNPHYDAPGPAQGLGPSVAIAFEDAQPEPSDPAPGLRTLTRERRMIAGKSAIVRQWISEEDDSQGVTIVMSGIVAGKNVIVTGWTIKEDWPRRNGEIWSVMDSIAIGGASANIPPAQPALGPVERIELTNIAAVVGGPRNATTISVKKPILVRTLRTYHWNNGRGAAPGSIALIDAGGRTLGSWRARGEPGQGGAPNAYWSAQVNLRLDPGSYTLTTSSNETWATNEGARWRGFYAMEFQSVLQPPAPVATAQQPDRPAGTWSTQPSQNQAQPPTTSAQAPSSIAPAPAEKDGARLLFGAGGALWDPFENAGGDFKSFARLENGALIVDVPSNSNWGKTGIKSKDVVVRFDPAAPTVVRLDFRFDAARTSSYVVSFGARKDFDEWSGHDARLGWSRADDGASSKLSLWIRGSLIMTARLGQSAPEELTVTISPDGVFSARTDNGQSVEGRVTVDAIESGLRVDVLAHAPGANKPAALALRSISLKQTPVPSDDRARETGDRIVLFDGALGAQFVAHSAHGGSFPDHAQLGRDGLVVDAPKESDWAKVGIRSPDPVLWLDRWGEGASAEFTYRFDPQRTTGFVIGLSAPGGGSDPGAPGLVFHWRRNGDGPGARAALFLLPSTAPVFDVQLLDRAPDEVRLLLTPEGVRVIADGFPDAIRPWDALKEGQGLRAWVYSHPDKAGLPVTMALRSISLAQQPGREAPAQAQAQAPETGVAALPVKALFSGVQSKAWEPIGVAGGDFARFARWGENRLIVETPEKASWAKTGLLSAAAVANLDYRFVQTPYRFTVQVDPGATSGFAVAVGLEKQPDMYPTTRMWASLIRETGDRYRLSLDRNPSQTWARPVSRAFVESKWDGRLLIDLGPQWTSVRLGDNGPLVRAPTGFDPSSLLYMSIQSHPARENEPARLALLGISGQWVTPDKMTAAARWELLDNDAFDATAFLKDLASGASRAASPAGADKPADGKITAQDIVDYLDAPAVATRPAPAEAPAPDKGKSGSLFDRFSPIGRANAQTAAPDCAKTITDHIDQARRIQITLGEQADLGGQLTSLGLTLLGKTKFEQDSVKESLRATADRIVNAWQDGQAIGEDWSAERTQDMVSHFMQAALKIGVTSDALGDDRTFREARRRVRDVWANALRAMPENKARALIVEMSQTIKIATPNHDLYKEMLDKGRDIDFGAAFGQGAEGEGKAMLWTLSNTALASFIPEYAIGKEIAATVAETAKATKAFVVNDSVRNMYNVWKEEIAKNGGAESKAFYDARTSIGDHMPLSGAKEMLNARKKKGDKTEVTDAAAEAFLFQQFDQWYKADQAAAKQGDGLAKANSAFAASKCRAELESEVAPKGATCEKELQLFKRYADLDAQVRGRLASWMQRGNQCNSPAAIDGETSHLVCQLLKYGETAYKTDLGKYLESCGLLDYAKDRDSAAKRVAQRLPGLTESKLGALLGQVGVTAPTEFLGCLCPNGFHYFNGPDAGGSCRRIGPLGGVSWAGFRADGWEACAKAYPLKDGRTVIDAIADALAGIHIDQK